MKYIIIPLFKSLYVLWCYLLAYPIIFCLLLLKAFWDFSLAPFDELKMPFITEESALYKKEGSTYYIYKTGWDYITGKKSYLIK